MDLSESFAPNSEQLTYAEIGDRVVTATVSKVVPRGDKPKDPAIHLTEFPGKPLLPGVNVGSLLRKAWGPLTKDWAGHKMTLFGDPDVYFGKEKTGGVRVSHVSHIDAPVTIPRRGKGARGSITVAPLADSPSEADWAAKIAASDSVDELRTWWQIASAPMRELIQSRVADLQAADQNEKDWQDVDAAKAESPEINFDDSPADMEAEK